jgi:hypothetical protein
LRLGLAFLAAIGTEHSVQTFCKHSPVSDTERAMLKEQRTAFTPHALSDLDHIMNEVWKELVADGVFSPTNFNAARAKLAQKVITFASSGWSAVQIKQLLSRALRNEHSDAALAGRDETRDQTA